MNLSDYGFTPDTQWAGFTFARVFRTPPQGKLPGEHIPNARNHIPLGYVFIIDQKFGDDAVWKIVAGHKKAEDLEARDPPLATAIRELVGETGIVAKPEVFKYEHKWFRPGRGGRPNHWQVLFSVALTEEDRDWLNSHHKENEGEQPKFFSVDEFHRVVREGKFMRSHLEMLEQSRLAIFPSTVR